MTEKRYNQLVCIWRACFYLLFITGIVCIARILWFGSDAPLGSAILSTLVALLILLSVRPQYMPPLGLYFGCVIALLSCGMYVAYAVIM